MEQAAGCTSPTSSGVIYNLLADRWQLSSDMDVNYMMIGGKGGPLRLTRVPLALMHWDRCNCSDPFTLLAAAARPRATPCSAS